jgi:hypothetical protein
MGCVPFSQAEIAAIAGWPPDSISAEGGYGIPYPGEQAHDGGTFYRLKHFGHPKYLSMKGHSPEIYVPICSASAGNGEGRSTVKITERTREKDKKALHSGRESRHSEAAFVGARADF